MSDTRVRRGVLCHLTEDDYRYLLHYADRHNITSGAAIARMLKLTRTVESLPEAHMFDDIMLRQLAQNERRKQQAT